MRKRRDSLAPGSNQGKVGFGLWGTTLSPGHLLGDSKPFQTKSRTDCAVVVRLIADQRYNEGNWKKLQIGCDSLLN